MTIRTSWYPSENSQRTWDKYTLKSGRVTTLKRQGIVHIQVIDSGVGLSENQLQSLFQDGTQFDVNELQAGQGSGLGLFISKGMAIQHGGDVKASSEGLGSGSTFTLQLPLYNIPTQVEDPKNSVGSTTPLSLTLESAPEHSSEVQSLRSSLGIPSPAPRPSNSSSLYILVVDDVASNRKLISRMARNRSHQVDEAKDGRDAVDQVKAAILKSTPYDTILMDFEMPVLNGPGAVMEIRRMGCDSLIVGVTGNVLDEDVKHFISCGANFVLPKPVKFQKLEEIWTDNGILECFRDAHHVQTSPAFTSAASRPTVG